MKEHFINELNRLLSTICDQGQQVETLIQRAITAFTAHDLSLAEVIVTADAAIDTEEVHIEEECLKILALYQPVATDLRTVIAMLKINVALERMADFGVHIAERVIKLHKLGEVPPPQPVDFGPMAEVVLGMLRDTMMVLSRSDLGLACKVIERDEAVDTMRRDNSLAARYAARSMPEYSGYYIECISISRELERIADLNVDICRHIIYLRTGQITRHAAG